ncbi:cytochrome P450 [Mucidula mucida]|nr:cytochrome P450 [Mucidula mucida]
MSIHVLTAIAAGILALASILFLRQKKSHPYPPGPPRYPIIGNLLNLPTQFEWKTFAKWSEELDSDILHIDVLGTSIVVLNSEAAVIDLFSKKGNMYSGRPSFVMANELMGWERALTSHQYNEDWRQQRRYFRQEFNETAVKRFFPKQVKAAHGLLHRLLDSPDDFMAHIKHMAATIVLSAAYGLEIQLKDDPLVQLNDTALKSVLDAARPGKYLVDMVESLKYIPEWFPGAGFKRKARQWRQLSHDMWNVPWDMTKKQMATGNYEPSFVSYCLEALNPSETKDRAADEYHIQSAAGSMYMAGVDTTLGSVGFFLLAMAQFPKAQATAQAEIDAVLGPGRLPDFGDMDSLPYVTALVREVLRYYVAAPIAIPHTATKDDVYRGYFIPKGAFIMSNLWAIAHDAAVFPEPFSFKPERYLGPDGKLDPSAKDPSDIVFGIGRRVCPGRTMGYYNVWIFVASILTAFNVRPGPRFDSEKVTMETGVISVPHTFPLIISTRSAEMSNIIRELY